MRVLVRILYAPVGIVAGIVAGILSRKLFTAVWSHIDDQEPPAATTQRASTGKVIGAAALQAAVFAATRAFVNREGAKFFHYLTGFWPGEREPDEA